MKYAGGIEMTSDLHNREMYICAWHNMFSRLFRSNLFGKCSDLGLLICQTWTVSLSIGAAKQKF